MLYYTDEYIEHRLQSFTAVEFKIYIIVDKH